MGSGISGNPDYKFCGIYADQGISGRAVAKRPQFLKMMEDAKNHKFDIVFTKSVARFGRNTEELLSMVRELRDEGIKVIFEKEQIDTFDPDAELFLTVAAAVAENDLRIYSENQRWSILKRFADGYISIGNKILGYRMNKETNTLEIEPTEAEIVKTIFSLYLSGMGIVAVAKKLTELGRYNIQGDTVWNKGSIRYLLICSDCGSKFRRYGRKLANGANVATWVCITHQKHSDRCGMLPLKEKDIHEAYRRVMNRLAGDISEVVQKVRNNIEEELSGGQSQDLAKCEEEIIAYQKTDSRTVPQKA